MVMVGLHERVVGGWGRRGGEVLGLVGGGCVLLIWWSGGVDGGLDWGGR